MRAWRNWQLLPIGRVRWTKKANGNSCSNTKNTEQMCEGFFDVAKVLLIEDLFILYSASAERGVVAHLPMDRCF